jgi:ATP-dependent DNA helicase RecG
VTISAQQLEEWLTAKEDEHLEFKEAKNSFHFEKLVKYCAALANEGGGSIVLGVSDARPRKVVGSQVFTNIERTKAGLIEKLRLRIEADELRHPDGRVLVFTAPARPIGVPIPVDGAYWMRAGEDLAPMTPDMLRRVFAESGPDFSAEICPKAKLGDLDSSAVNLLSRLWRRKSSRNSANEDLDQLLVDTELLVRGGLTYAALILLGTREALGRLLAQAEIIFEYRSSEAPGPAADRVEFRQGFLGVLDPLWERINLRNDLQHFQQRLFMLDMPTFSERAIREAILNAVSHRDYRSGSSVFVRQFPRRIEIVSPGGFPAGITPENLLWQQSPRNRRIADVLGKCGLVERAGQGFDLMYRECILQSKALPDFTHTDAHFVWVTLHGEMQDQEFLRYLEEIGTERTATFATEDFLVLDLIHREEPVPDQFKARAHRLAEMDVIERVGRGRGVRYLLSRRFYRFVGKPGVYTRKRGLDRETNKALLLQHLRHEPAKGSPLSELQQVLPALSRDQLKRLLDELHREGRVRLVGERRGAKWLAA